MCKFLRYRRAWSYGLLLVLGGILIITRCRPQHDPLLNRPLPTKTDEVLGELFNLRRDLRPNYKARFVRLLQSIAPKLSHVPVTAGKESLQWTTLTLNTYGEPFDGVRFASPLSQRADLRWCFVVEDERCAPEWSIQSAQGELQSGFESYQSDANLDLGVPDVPAKNLVFLQPLDGGVIQPGREYILWFAFPQKGKPVRMQIAIRVDAQGSFPESTTLEELARDLGLSTPLKHTRIESADALLKESQLRYRSHDLPTALQLAERARQEMPDHREILFFAGYLNLVRGRQLSANFGPDKGAAHVLAAAQELRQFRDRYRERTDVENLWLGEGLYGEAECLARMNEKAKAIASLREALVCGFEAQKVAVENFQPAVSPQEIDDVVAEFRKK